MTTIEQLIRAAFTWQRRAILHRVRYVEHAKIKSYVIGDYSDMLQFKHAAYKYENEVRLIVPQQNEKCESNPMGIRLVVPDLNRFIRTVVVSPEATPEFVKVVKELVIKYELTTQVLESNLTTTVV